MRNGMYFVYVLFSTKDNRFYIGYTANIEKRFLTHVSGNVRSTKYRGGLILIYYEAYIHRLDAKGREKFLKGGSGHKYLYKQLAHFLRGMLQ